MAALATVANYLSAARTLLQDTVTPYRYSDADLVEAMNFGILDARRIRPDLFLSTFDDIPSYTVASTTVDFNEQYRTALLMYMVGHAQLRDDEDTQDQRAAAFLNRFTSQLMTGM